VDRKGACDERCTNAKYDGHEIEGGRSDNDWSETGWSDAQAVSGKLHKAGYDRDRIGLGGRRNEQMSESESKIA
jgi:hypothetical protein